MNGPQFHLYGCVQPVSAVVPKLLDAARRQDMRAVVRSSDAERIDALNTSLWEGGGSFLPHGSDGDEHPEAQPVFLTTTTSVPNGAELLILLDGADHADADAFKRVCLLYDASDPQAAQSAEAFTRTRRADGTVQWSLQTTEGRWEPQAVAAESPTDASAPTAAAAPDDGPAGATPSEADPAGEAPRLESAPVERTLSIIKPDATAANLTGRIIARLEDTGLRFVAQRRLLLARRDAEGFYAEHRERPFFGALCDFMTSGPVVVQVLEGVDAIARNREVMGATNPADAEEGSLRKEFGSSIERNAVHGSDSPAAAQREIAYFFSAVDIVG